MERDKPTHADNRPTKDPQRQFPREKVARGGEADPARRLEEEARLQAKAETQPVSGTASRPYREEKAVPVRSHSKSRDPADSAAQPRSATEKKAR